MILSLVLFANLFFSDSVNSSIDSNFVRINSNKVAYVKNANFSFSKIIQSNNRNVKWCNGVSFKKSFKKCNQYWLHFSISNPSNIYIYRYVELLDNHVNIEKKYLVSKSGTDSTHMSFGPDFIGRDINHKNFVMDIKLMPKDTVGVYLLVTARRKFNTVFWVRTHQRLLEYAVSEYFLIGIFYGLILLMVANNLMIYISTKENIYLFYVIYVLSYALNTIYEDGIFFQFIWNDFPIINSILEFGVLPFLVLSFSFFTMVYFSLWSKERFISKVILGLDVLYLILFAGIYIGNIPHGFDILFFIPFLFIYYVGWFMKIKKNHPLANLFLLAFSFMIIGALVYVLRINNLIPQSIYFTYIFNFGFLFEVLVLSYALSRRMKIMLYNERELNVKIIDHLKEIDRFKDDLNKDLEQKVDLRTQELKEANTQLVKQALEIKRMMVLLSLDNKKLSKNIEVQTKARALDKEMTFDEFKGIYPTDLACFNLLSELKWNKEYRCKKCGYMDFSLNKMDLSRRCSKCGYNESTTSHTLLNNVRFQLNKALYIVYFIGSSRKDITSEELARRLLLRQKTCWSFKQKVLTAQKTFNQMNKKKTNDTTWTFLLLQEVI